MSYPIPTDWHSYPPSVIKAGIYDIVDGNDDVVAFVPIASAKDRKSARVRSLMIAAAPESLKALAVFPEFPDDYNSDNRDAVEAFAEAVRAWKTTHRAKAMDKARYKP